MKDDVRAILRNTEVFSSRYGMAPSLGTVPDDGSPIPESDMPRGAELRRRFVFDRFGGGTEAEFLIVADPPAHTKIRKLVSAAFSPRVVSNLEGPVRALAREALDAIEPERPTDIVPTLLRPVPIYTIAHLLGAPQDDWRTFARWSDAFTEFDASLANPEAAGDRSELMEQLMEFGAYFLAQLAERGSTPATTCSPRSRTTSTVSR